MAKTEIIASCIRLPAVYKDAIKSEKLNLSEFVREAMRREFKRRKIAVPEVEVKRGYPTDD